MKIKNNKPTDEEIIKALQCCLEPFNECRDCPLYDDYSSCEINILDFIDNLVKEMVGNEE